MSSTLAPHGHSGTRRKEGVLTTYPVAPLVNNVHNDGPELIERVEAEG